MTQPEILQIAPSFIEVKSVLLILIVVAGAWLDIKSRKIPNRLILTGLALSFAVQIFSGVTGFIAWCLGLLIGLGIFLPLHLLRAMGAGDVKLVATAGAFLGPVQALDMALMTLLAGGVLALACALWQGVFRRALKNIRFILIHTWVKTPQRDGARIDVAATTGNLPYAVAIAAGTLLHLFLERTGHALLT